MTLKITSFLNFLIAFVGFLFFGSSTIITAQKSFVAFDSSPQMTITNTKVFPVFKVKYQTTQKSTIYLELKKGRKVYAKGHYLVSDREKGIAKIQIQPLKRAVFTPSDNYSYKLYLYAGEPNDWSSKACHSKTISQVKVMGNFRQKQLPTSSSKGFMKSAPIQNIKTRSRMQRFTDFFQ